MTHRPYPAYKDSGIEWLGEVPEHWEVKRLKQIVAVIESGTSVNAVDIPIGESEIGVLKTSCVSSGAFRASENKAVIPEEYDRVTCPLKSGAIIVSRMNTPDLVGAAGLVREDYQNLYLPDRLWQILFNGVQTEFLAHWTSSLVYRAQVRMACAGTSSSMQNLSQVQFLGFELVLPSLPEQHAIAAFLDRETSKIDALVAEQERLIDLLTEKRQAVISHAVTKGLDPSVQLKDSGIEWLGEVPEHWDVKKLRMVADVQTGIAKGKDNEGRATIEVPYLRVANVQDGYLDLTEIAMIDIAEEDLSRYLLRSGDVLMNEGGDFDKLGRGHVWRGEIDPCIHQNHVFAVRPHGVQSEWLNSFTGSDFAQFYFKTVTGQSKVIRMWTLESDSPGDRGES